MECRAVQTASWLGRRHMAMRAGVPRERPRARRGAKPRRNARSAGQAHASAAVDVALAAWDGFTGLALLGVGAIASVGELAIRSIPNLLAGLMGIVATALTALAICASLLLDSLPSAISAFLGILSSLADLARTKPLAGPAALSLTAAKVASNCFVAASEYLCAFLHSLPLPAVLVLASLTFLLARNRNRISHSHQPSPPHPSASNDNDNDIYIVQPASAANAPAASNSAPSSEPSESASRFQRFVNDRFKVSPPLSSGGNARTVPPSPPPSRDSSARAAGMLSARLSGSQLSVQHRGPDDIVPPERPARRFELNSTGVAAKPTEIDRTAQWEQDNVRTPPRRNAAALAAGVLGIQLNGPMMFVQHGSPDDVALPRQQSRRSSLPIPRAQTQMSTSFVVPPSEDDAVDDEKSDLGNATNDDGDDDCITGARASSDYINGASSMGHKPDASEIYRTQRGDADGITNHKDPAETSLALADLETNTEALRRAQVEVDHRLSVGRSHDASDEKRAAEYRHGHSADGDSGSESKGGSIDEGSSWPRENAEKVPQGIDSQHSQPDSAIIDEIAREDVFARARREANASADTGPSEWAQLRYAFVQIAVAFSKFSPHALAHVVQALVHGTLDGVLPLWKRRMEQMEHQRASAATDGELPPFLSCYSNGSTERRHPTPSASPPRLSPAATSRPLDSM